MTLVNAVVFDFRVNFVALLNFGANFDECSTTIIRPCAFLRKQSNDSTEKWKNPTDMESKGEIFQNTLLSIHMRSSSKFLWIYDRAARSNSKKIEVKKISYWSNGKVIFILFAAIRVFVCTMNYYETFVKKQKYLNLFYSNVKLNFRKFSCEGSNPVTTYSPEEPFPETVT